MVKAIRGAIQADADTSFAIESAVYRLYQRIMEENKLENSQIISLIISQTDDLCSTNPASALRKQGIDYFPFFCVQELKTEQQFPSTIRFLMHVEWDDSVEEVKHIYEGGARALRPDLC